jgi:hypothetical protein
MVSAPLPELKPAGYRCSTAQLRKIAVGLGEKFAHSALPQFVDDKHFSHLGSDANIGIRVHQEFAIPALFGISQWRIFC